MTITLTSSLLGIASLYGVHTILLIALILALYRLQEKRFEAHLAKEMHEFETRQQEKLLEIQNYHGVSKRTFEKAFNKKMDIYESLLNAVNRLNSFIRENPRYDEPDSHEDQFKYVDAIISIIRSNQLYISTELSRCYDQWYRSALAYIKNANIEEYEVWQNSFGTVDDEIAAHYAGLPDRFEMMAKTKNEFQSILDCIDKDIKHIRASIERPMTQSENKKQ